MVLPWVFVLMFVTGLCLAIGPQGQGRTVIGWILLLVGGVAYIATTGFDGVVILVVILAFLAPLGLGIYVMAHTAENP